MKAEVLLKIKNHLRDTPKELSELGMEDKQLRSRYAEYLVAYELAKRGHDVQILNERKKNKNADICLADIKKRVEVKGKVDEDGWTDASFGKGNQILNNKTAFDASDDSKVEEMFVFTNDELKEVAKHRKCGAQFPKTNPCLFLRCQSFREYIEYMEKMGYEKLKIEIDLNRHPEKYDRAWDKLGL